MAIRQRAVTPKAQSRGRHPMLKLGNQSTTIYNFIEIHPDCTREDIYRTISIPKNAATGRVAELLGEGLIEETGTKVSPHSRKRVKTLRVTGSMTGNRNDRVRVIVKVYCDADGHYYATAHVPGQSHDGGLGTLCITKSMTIAVTPPGKLQTIVNDGLTIDSDYHIVE